MGPDFFDLIIIITLALFLLRGISNGLIGEIAGIISLIGAFWAAKSWNEQLAPYLSFITDPSWRIIAACVLIFIAVMFAIAWFARMLNKLLAYSFVGWLNKIGGAILGLAKGIILWAVIFIFLSALFQNEPFLRESRAYPYFKQIVAQIQPWMPEGIANKINI